MSERVAKVSLDLLEVRDQKHRLELDIPSLADSILTAGQINPITVKAVGSKYRVVSGRRRYSALKYIREKIGKKIEALVYIKNIDALHEELITIDENIMRQQLSEVEFDEAIYRRKQIYEELHPTTKKHVAGGVARSQKKGPKPQAFTADAAGKLHVSRRTIEKAISRAARASDAVKKARAEGLGQSKVDLLVALEPKDQDILLPIVKELDFAETKALLESADRVGAKAAALYFEEKDKEDPELKVLLRESDRMIEMLHSALEGERIFRGESKHGHIKTMEMLKKTLERFITLQKAETGYVQAIRRRGTDTRVIPARK